METQLILVEGLPGSGKSTTATLTNEFLKRNKISAELYSEGNLDHPADYDGVASFSEQEFHNLLNVFPNFKALFKQNAKIQGKDILVPYQKLRVDQKVDFPEEVMDKFYSKDVYELPLEEHIRLVTEKWQNFANKAKQEKKTYIFECCYIQNPVTTAFVKYNAPTNMAMNYVQGLTDAVRDLNPLLIYVEQNDIDFTFKKALNERSEGWADFFIDYYTNQGYGLAKQLKGINGTIEVLKKRSQLEKEMISQLDIEKVFLDNSNFDKESYQEQLEKLLDRVFRVGGQG